MPCYTVQTVELELQVRNKDRIIDAARALGWELGYNEGEMLEFFTANNVHLEVDLGARTISSYDDEVQVEKAVNLLKKSYAIDAVKTAAKRSGWRTNDLRRLGARKAVNKIAITR